MTAPAASAEGPTSPQGLKARRRTLSVPVISQLTWGWPAAERTASVSKLRVLIPSLLVDSVLLVLLRAAGGIPSPGPSEQLGGWRGRPQGRVGLGIGHQPPLGAQMWTQKQ